jgi:hypothetical protein
MTVTDSAAAVSVLLRRVSVISFCCVVPIASGACATKAAPLTTVTICGNSVPVPDIAPPSGSGPVVLWAAPCLMRDDGTLVIPRAYRRYIELQASRPLEGVWVQYDESTRETMQADYRRLWDTGRLSELTFTIVDHTFPNGVIGKFVTYAIKER